MEDFQTGTGHWTYPAAPCPPDTIAADFQSEAGEASWRVFVYVPPGTPPAGGWPLLVLTDGNAAIGTAVDAVRVQASWPDGTNVEPGVVAAVGYPVDGPYDPLRRSLDLGPPPGRTYPPFTQNGPPVVTGGADRLLGFIETDLLPFVEARAPIDPARRTLSGHSFGGLFALHALFSGTETFSRYVAVSPSIYWEDAVVLASERRFAASWRGGGTRFVHLSAGGFEGDDLAPFQYGRTDTAERLEQRGTTRTISLAREMAERLARLPGVATRFEVFAGETHMSVVAVSVARSVQVAFEIPADAGAERL